MELNKSESAIFKKVTADKTDSNWGVKMQQMSTLLMSKINKATYTKKESPITEAFPGLKAFVNSSQNNIDDFVAMRELAARL